MTQLAKVRLSIESDPSLRIGMFARATIDAGAQLRRLGAALGRYYRTEGASVQVIVKGRRRDAARPPA